MACKYMNYYSFNDPRVTKGWVGLFGWPIADRAYQQSRSCQPYIGRRAAKVRRPKTDITEPGLCAN